MNIYPEDLDRWNQELAEVLSLQAGTLSELKRRDFQLEIRSNINRRYCKDNGEWVPFSVTFSRRYSGVTGYSGCTPEHLADLILERLVR